jgi:Secretion system C-terminal sorting domain
VCAKVCHRRRFFRIVFGDFVTIFAQPMDILMKLTKGFWVLLATVTMWQWGHGQCIDNRFEILDANRVAARFNNGVNMFWDMLGQPAYEVPRGSGITASFAGGIWIGGLDPQGQLHVSASTYRQVGMDWYGGPTRSQPGTGCALEIEATEDIMGQGVKLLSNGKVLILSKNEILIYDPVTEIVLTRVLPAPRLWLDALELPDGRIFIYGDDIYPAKNPVLFMDTVTYTITGGPTLNWFHQETTIDLLDNGRVLISGVVGCEVFDPVTNLSTAVPGMIYPRIKHGTAHLPNGDIMAFGGGLGLGGTGLTISTQYFDDTLGYWFPGPPLSFGRQRAIATTMPDGKVFISGGSDANAGTNIYDPLLDSMYVGASLPKACNAHAVHVIDSSTVLISGFSGAISHVWRFNIYTGESEEIRIQKSGVPSLLISPTEALLQVQDPRHLARYTLPTDVQDQSRWEFIWKLDRNMIDAFRADFMSGQVDFDRYPQIASWPAHGDEGAGEDRNLAPFVDVNGDGLYRPGMDGDYPCIVGDQALWWVYNDVGAHLESGGIPLGLQVEAMAYAVDCNNTPCPDSSLDYTTFLHLEVTNQSDTAYHNMYMGEFDDFDLGGYADDFMGSDSALNLAFAYNSTDQDLLYGQHPPAWGATVLPNGQLGMSGAIFYENVGGNYGFPVVAGDFYNFLQGRYHDGQQIVNNGLDGNPSTAPGVPTSYMFSSTDGFCGGPMTGWSEITAGRNGFDRRFVVNSAQFSLNPGEKIQWDLAFVFARDSSNLASVCALKTATAAVQDWWQNQLDRSCFSTVVGTHPPKTPQALKIVPNPVNGSNFMVEFGDGLMEDGQLELIDLNGRVIQQSLVTMGAARAVVDASRLPAGVYLVRLSQADGARSQRVIVW